jgi:hypothetical protein
MKPIASNRAVAMRPPCQRGAVRRRGPLVVAWKIVPGAAPRLSER